MPARTTGRRFWLLVTAALAGAMLLITAAMPAAASVRPLEWHRYNIYEPLAPSHERLRCLTNDQWRCKYDTVPEPQLGFSNPKEKATFIGTDVTGTWECPEADWFPSDICDSATRVISGVQTFTLPGEGELFSVDAVYIVTDDGTLWNYWVDQFVCPWYPTFEQALTSPPDCTFNPEL